jgi:hypothetical protein
VSGGRVRHAAATHAAHLLSCLAWVGQPSCSQEARCLLTRRSSPRNRQSSLFQPALLFTALLCSYVVVYDPDVAFTRALELYKAARWGHA